MPKEFKTTEAQRQADKRYREKHREEKRRYARQYCAAHREEILQRKKKYYAEHKEELRKHNRKRYARIRTEAPWLLHWNSAKARCNNLNYHGYKWYGGKGVRMLLTPLEVELLYKIARADKMERPSIDRINSNGDYHFGNCRFIEQSENARRRHAEKQLKEEQCKSDISVP